MKRHISIPMTLSYIMLAIFLALGAFASCSDSKAEQMPPGTTGEALIESTGPSHSAPTEEATQPTEGAGRVEDTVPNVIPTDPTTSESDPGNKDESIPDETEKEDKKEDVTSKPTIPAQTIPPAQETVPETEETTRPTETVPPTASESKPNLWLEPIEPTVMPSTEPTTAPTTPATKPTEPTVTKPTVPAPDAPSEPPKPTEPVQTDPNESQTTPTEPPHQHLYTESKRTNATCEGKGSATYTCGCGASYTKSIDALGHDWSDWMVVKEATYTEKGEEGYVCKRCGEKDTIPIPKLKYDLPEDTAEAIAMLTKIYINELRNQEGACSAADMPGCDKMSKRRSEQMASKQKVEHNLADWKAAATELKYGEYVDPGKYGMDLEPYYSLGGQEAVGSTYDAFSTVEKIARRLADGVHSSASHWSYVGDDSNKYMSVGVTLNNGTWYCCIITAKVNLDEHSSHTRDFSRELVM